LPLASPDVLSGLIADIAKPDDFVVCLGAGNITAWANDLPAALTLAWGDSSAAASGSL
jgi:UDP-N-acetylmuramate--alanine ligase